MARIVSLRFVGSWSPEGDCKSMLFRLLHSFNANLSINGFLRGSKFVDGDSEVVEYALEEGDFWSRAEELYRNEFLANIDFLIEVENQDFGFSA